MDSSTFTATLQAFIQAADKLHSQTSGFIPSPASSTPVTAPQSIPLDDYLPPPVEPLATLSALRLPLNIALSISEIYLTAANDFRSKTILTLQDFLRQPFLHTSGLTDPDSYIKHSLQLYSRLYQQRMRRLTESLLRAVLDWFAEAENRETNISSESARILEAAYRCRRDHLNQAEKTLIARRAGITERQVVTWFANRRQRGSSPRLQIERDVDSNGRLVAPRTRKRRHALSESYIHRDNIGDAGETSISRLRLMAGSEDTHTLQQSPLATLRHSRERDAQSSLINSLLSIPADNALELIHSAWTTSSDDESPDSSDATLIDDLELDDTSDEDANSDQSASSESQSSLTNTGRPEHQPGSADHPPFLPFHQARRIAENASVPMNRASTSSTSALSSTSIGSAQGALATPVSYVPSEGTLRMHYPYSWTAAADPISALPTFGGSSANQVYPSNEIGLYDPIRGLALEFAAANPFALYPEVEAATGSGNTLALGTTNSGHQEPNQDQEQSSSSDVSPATTAIDSESSTSVLASPAQGPQQTFTSPTSSASASPTGSQIWHLRSPNGELIPLGEIPALDDVMRNTSPPAGSGSPERRDSPLRAPSPSAVRQHVPDWLRGLLN